jgi:O-antigen/teichoic acid export membrane protein
MQKKLLSGLFWVLLANLLVKPFWILGIEVGVQNTVGNEAYGFYHALLSFSYIFNILLDLGVTNFNTRNIAQHPQLIQKHLSGILGIKLCLLGLYLVVTFTAGLLMGYGSREFGLLALLTLCQALNSLILYLRSNFEGLLLFKWDSLFSVLDRVLMIVICGFLLWGPHFSIFEFQFSIYHFVYAQLIAYGITAALAFTVIARKARFRRLRWDRRFFLVILRKSAPFALLVLLMASYNRIDPLLLSWLHPLGTYQAGIYAGAFRLLDALTMVAYLVSVPLLPVFSRMTAENDAQLGATTRMVTGLMTVFSVTAAALFSSHSELFMQLLYHRQPSTVVADYIPVFSILVWGIVPISMTYVFGTLLTAAGKLRQLNLLAAVALAVNIAVNLVLIPRLGAVGSAWAAVTAQGFMAIAQIVVAVGMLHLRPAKGYLLRLLLFAAVVTAAMWLLPAMPWWAALAAGGAVGLAVALPLRLIDVKNILQIVSNE